MLMDFDSSKMVIVDNDSPSDVEKTENEENRVGQIHGDKNGVFFFWGGEGWRSGPKQNSRDCQNQHAPPPPYTRSVLPAPKSSLFFPSLRKCQKSHQTHHIKHRIKRNKNFNTTSKGWEKLSENHLQQQTAYQQTIHPINEYENTIYFNSYKSCYQIYKYILTI